MFSRSEASILNRGFTGVLDGAELFLAVHMQIHVIDAAGERFPAQVQNVALHLAGLNLDNGLLAVRFDLTDRPPEHIAGVRDPGSDLDITIICLGCIVQVIFRCPEVA